MALGRQLWCLSSVNWLFSMLCHMIHHPVYASVLTPGHDCPEVVGASCRASISLHAPSHSHLTIASSHESLITKIQRSRPGQYSPAQGSCSRPACRSAIPRQSDYVCLGCPNLPGVAGSTHLPLCKSQVHLSPALGGESLVVFQASAHDAAGDGEVAVVAAQSEETPRQSPRVARAIGGCRSGRRVNRYSPEACGFPRERHLGWLFVRLRMNGFLGVQDGDGDSKVRDKTAQANDPAGELRTGPGLSHHVTPNQASISLLFTSSSLTLRG